jgi:cell division protein FtsQ
MFEKNKLKKILTISLWSVLGLAGIALLVAALNKKHETVCTGIDIEIGGVNNNFFINKQDIIVLLQNSTGEMIKGRRINDFNLDTMEMEIKKDVWINKAELYFDKNGVLKVSITEKDPVARIFCIDGSSYYIDNNKNMLPLSDRHAARLPVFTNFPTPLKVLSVKDSALLEDVKTLSLFIQKDAFLMAIIDQVNINNDRKFELIPKIGEQVITFGDVSGMEAKFEKLKLFYKKVIPVYGWSRYNRINLEYKGQVVATINGIDDVAADSVQTIQLMKALATYSSLMASDTTQSMLSDNEHNTTNPELINKSIQREEADDNSNEQTTTPVNIKVSATKPAPVVVPTKAAVTKPITAKPATLKTAATTKSAITNKTNNKQSPPWGNKGANKTTVKPKEVMPQKKVETKTVIKKTNTANEY